MAYTTVLTTTASEHTSQRVQKVVLRSAAREGPKCLDPPCKIAEGLYIGSREAESNLSSLRAAEVCHVLQAGAELAPSFPGKFVYKHLAISDEEGEDIVSVFADAFAFINEGRKSGAVLVHCAQGISRSASIAVGYLMAHEGYTYTTALAHVQAARPAVDPNEGFTLQLQEFERMGCNLEAWRGWDKQRLERCFMASSVSGRRAVHGFSDLIRRFHVHDLDDDDSTVFCDYSVML